MTHTYPQRHMHHRSGQMHIKLIHAYMSVDVPHTYMPVLTLWGLYRGKDTHNQSDKFTCGL